MYWSKSYVPYKIKQKMCSLPLTLGNQIEYGPFSIFFLRRKKNIIQLLNKTKSKQLQFQFNDINRNKFQKRKYLYRKFIRKNTNKFLRFILLYSENNYPYFGYKSERLLEIPLNPTLQHSDL